MNNVTYTTQDEHGRAIDVTRNESVDSNDSASVHVTPQLQATTEGAVFIKGGDDFDFGHVERFIQNPPHGQRLHGMIVQIHGSILLVTLIKLWL